MESDDQSATIIYACLFCVCIGLAYHHKDCIMFVCWQ